MLFVQPVTVYLLIVVWRILRNPAMSRVEWKSVFTI